jgi:hypothetical protein
VAHEESKVRGRSGVTTVVAALALTAGIVACEGPGETPSIAAAEQEIETAVDAVADGLGLEPRTDQPLRSRSRCELPGGTVGASNTVGARGTPMATDDPLDRGAQLILESGFELVDSGLDDTVFGRREGMRLTVVLAPNGDVAVDAATGCKPLRD